MLNALSGLALSALTPLAERLAEGVILVDPSGLILYVNKAGARLHGYTPDQLVGCNVHETLGEPGEILHDDFNAWLIFRGERLHRHRAGHLTNVLVDAQPLPASSDLPSGGYILFMQPVPENPPFYTALGVPLDSLFAAMLDLVFVFDADGLIHDCHISPHITGLKREHLKNKHIRDLLDRPNMLRVMEMIRQLSDTGHIKDQLLGLPSYSSGTLRWFRFSAARIEGWKVRPARYLAVAHEVTDRLLAIQSEQHNHQLAEALRQLAEVLSSTLDLDEILDRILEYACTIVPHDAASITLLEGDVGRIVRAKGYNDSGRTHLLQVRFKASDTPTMQTIISTGKPLVLGNTYEYPGWIAVKGLEWIRSYAGVPIFSNGKVIGFLNLDSAQKDAFTQEHIYALEAIASQVAIAVRNAGLYAQAQARARALGVLNDVSIRITRETELNSTLTAIVQSAIELVGARGGGLLVYRPEEESLEWVLSEGNSNLQPGLRVRRGEGLCGRAWEMGRVLYVSSYRNWPRRLDIPESAQLNAVIAAPITWGDEFYGVLTANTGDDQRRFTRDDAKLFCQLAIQASIAIKNARLFDELRQHVRDLEERNSELDAFSYTVAHDLKSPLQVIMGFANVLRTTYADELSEEILQMVQHIEDYSIQLKENVDDLLLIARLRNAEAEMVSVNPGEVLNRVIARMEERLELRGMQIVVPRRIPAVRGHEPWLDAIFSNLIDNALKYAGTENATPRLTIRARREGRLLRLEFEDNGVGIPAEHQARVFEMFARFHPREAPGSGLGLSIVKRLVDRMEGVVGVRSKNGEGSTFWLLLPRADT